jgi:hypothetical protein
MTHVPADLAVRLTDLCHTFGVELVEGSLADAQCADLEFDDVFILDGDADKVDLAATKLAKDGVLAIARSTPMSRPIRMDLGRVHYDHIVYVGTTGRDLDAAYQKTPVRASLKPQGTVWIVGAGGPMGRMHLQRAIESRTGPRRILATEVSPERVGALSLAFDRLAQRRGLELTIIDAGKIDQAHTDLMADVASRDGIDDVEVMAAIPALVVESTAHLTTGGVINVFAGLKRGTIAPIDPWLVYGPRQIRLIGHSGSALDDQIRIVKQAASGHISPERSMVALAGLMQLPQALQSMIDAVYPGKTVIFPAVLDCPITTLPDLQHVLPHVYERLAEGRAWTTEAEAAFLDAMLTGGVQ